MFNGEELGLNPWTLSESLMSRIGLLMRPHGFVQNRVCPQNDNCKRELMNNHGICFFAHYFETNPEVFLLFDCQEKLPGRILFVGHGASCLGIAGAFGREDYVA